MGEEQLIVSNDKLRTGANAAVCVFPFFQEQILLATDLEPGYLSTSKHYRR